MVKPTIGNEEDQHLLAFGIGIISTPDCRFSENLEFLQRKIALDHIHCLNPGYLAIVTVESRSISFQYLDASNERSRTAQLFDRHHPEAVTLLRGCRNRQQNEHTGYECLIQIWEPESHVKKFQILSHQSW